MWRQSMQLSPGYAQELRAFWGFADDFVFQENVDSRKS
jgi:hypothetical protein